MTFQFPEVKQLIKVQARDHLRQHQLEFEQLH